MSECLVVDASIAVKWYVPEIHADAALGYLDEKYNLLVPELFLAEFGNIIWKKCRIGEISDPDAITIFNAIEDVPLQFFQLYTLLRPAFELAVGLDRTVYDCMYLALAVIGRCRMVTADRKFHEAVIHSPYAQNILWVAG